MPNTNIRHWQKSFLKKLFPTLNSNRNGKIWSWERHFLLWKCCYWQSLKVGSRDLINVIYFLLLLRTGATLEWNGYMLWESATINLFPSNESAPERYFRAVFWNGKGKSRRWFAGTVSVCTPLLLYSSQSHLILMSQKQLSSQIVWEPFSLISS